jgi:hypothetical protein
MLSLKFKIIANVIVLSPAPSIMFISNLFIINIQTFNFSGKARGRNISCFKAKTTGMEIKTNRGLSIERIYVVEILP